MVEERESEVGAITALEQTTSSMMGAYSLPTGKDNVEMVDNFLATKPILQEVPTPDVSEMEAPPSSRGEGSEVEVLSIALDEITTWMVKQLGD